MKNKRVIVVHCWDGYPEYCWYPYTKKELDKEDSCLELPEIVENIINISK